MRGPGNSCDGGVTVSPGIRACDLPGHGCQLSVWDGGAGRFLKQQRE